MEKKKKDLLTRIRDTEYTKPVDKLAPFGVGKDLADNRKTKQKRLDEITGKKKK